GSFRDIEKALHFEITRQQSLADRGMPIAAETRHWDEARKITVSSRSKEEEQDYRYFPEEDIPKIIIEKKLLDNLKKAMPESIFSKKERYINKYGITPQVAEILASDKFYSDLFEQSHSEKNAKEIANLITTDLKGFADTREQREQLKL